MEKSTKQKAKDFAKRFSSIKDAITAIGIILEHGPQNVAETIRNNYIAIQVELEKMQQRESMDWEKLLEFINGRTGRKYQLINDAAKRKYRARLREGYTKQQIQNAINNCVESEHHKGTSFKYLTPEFFSRTSTLDIYGHPPKKEEYIPTK